MILAGILCIFGKFTPHPIIIIKTAQPLSSLTGILGEWYREKPMMECEDLVIDMLTITRFVCVATRVFRFEMVVTKGKWRSTR